MKTAFTFLAGLVLAAFIAVPGQAALVDNLVSYWTFDDTLTDSVGGYATNQTGGGTLNYSAGKFGNAIDLDGGSEQIEVTEVNQYDFGAAGNGMSISAWFTVAAWDTSWQALVAKGEGSEFRLHRSGGSATALNWSANGNINSSGINVNDGQLHHVVVTHDGLNSNSTKEIWIDGALRGTVTNGGQIVDNNQNLMIGENPDALGREWEGLVDDVGIWGRPLTSGEIAALWNNGDGALIGSLIAPAVPEPSTFVLGVLALFGLGAVKWRRRRARN